MPIKHPITRVALVVVGSLAIAFAILELRSPIRLVFEPSHRVRPIFAPVGLLVGAAFLILAFAPARRW